MHAIGAESFFGRLRPATPAVPVAAAAAWPATPRHAWSQGPCFSIWAIDYMWTATSDWLEWDEIEAVEIE